MVSTVEKTVSLTKESQDLLPQTGNSLKTTSVDYRYRYSDPDLLIREYFLSSPPQRAKLRKLVFQNIKSWQSIMVVLKWSRRKEVCDAYDAASDLLAECADINLLQGAIQYLESANLLATSSNTSNLFNLDDFWEVLVKGIAYAYQIPAQERFQVILNLFPASNRRIFKAAIIDALVILADEMDIEPIRNSISRFSSTHEPDLYIRNYAQEALHEIS